MPEKTIEIYQCDMNGVLISRDVPVKVVEMIAKGLVLPFMQDVQCFRYHFRENGNFYQVNRK